MRKPHNDSVSTPKTTNARSPRAQSRGEEAVRDAQGTQSVSTSLDTNGGEEGRVGKGKHVPERKCILSGKHDARDTLIRLAIGPEGQVAPDVRAKAPGRGAWIGVTKAELVEAQAKGKLKGALARAFKGATLTIPETLADAIEAQLERATLDRLGLEARAGHLISGAEKIDAAARSGQVHLLLHARDAGEDGRKKRDQSWRVGQDAEGTGLAGTILPVDRGPLSMALGRDNAVHIAITDRAAATRILSALTRWQFYTGCDTGALANNLTDSGKSAASAISD